MFGLQFASSFRSVLAKCLAHSTPTAPWCCWRYG